MNRDYFPAACPSCGSQTFHHPESAADDDEVVCGECRASLGTYGQLRKQRFASARAEAERLLGLHRRPRSRRVTID